MFIQGAYREPTFFYESVGDILGFILIVFVYKKYSKPKRGDMVYAYLLWYGAVRIVVEGLRTDSLMFGRLRMAQVISVVFIVVGLLGMLGVFRKVMKNPKAGDTVRSDGDAAEHGTGNLKELPRTV